MDNSRRALLAGAVGIGASAALAACSGTSSNTGTGVTQDAGTVNDMIVQQGELTITAWNAVKNLPGFAYPSTLLKESLELAQLREKLLRNNVTTKQGWVTVYSYGTCIGQFEVRGKISSNQSSMTATDLIYTANDNSGSVIAGPGDDLSFGINEGGDSGVFFFLQGGGMISMAGLQWIYSDVPLNLPALAAQTALQYDKNATPTSIAPGSTLFK